MEQSQTDRKTNFLWRFFSSVKLTLFLLIVLAAISIIGTVIPQQEEAVRYAQNISPSLARFFSFLQLFDMYHSVWFRIIMGFLTLNLRQHLIQSRRGCSGVRRSSHSPPPRLRLVLGFQAPCRRPAGCIGPDGQIRVFPDLALSIHRLQSCQI